MCQVHRSITIRSDFTFYEKGSSIKPQLKDQNTIYIQFFMYWMVLSKKGPTPLSPLCHALNY